MGALAAIVAMRNIATTTVCVRVVGPEELEPLDAGVGSPFLVSR